MSIPVRATLFATILLHLIVTANAEIADIKTARAVAAIASSTLPHRNSEKKALRIAAEIMNTSEDKIKLEKERGGMSSAFNYHFFIGKNKYLLKIFSDKQNPDDRAREIKTLRAFSDLKIGGRFVGENKEKSGYVREYIDGSPIKYNDILKEKTLRKLAAALKTLHSSKFDLPARSQLERAERHYSRILEKNIAVPTGYSEHYETYKKEIAATPKDEVFCHNDLNPHNIILGKDGSIYFIDISKAGLSSRLEDLGYITMLNGIYGANLEKFLEEYYGCKPTVEQIDNVKKYQKLTCFLTAIVWLDFSESQRDKEIDYSKRVHKLDEMLKSDKIKTAEEFVKNNIQVSVRTKDKNNIREYFIAFYRAYLES